VSAVDGPSRFYVLWRYSYRTVELDAGEANGTLEMVEKKKGKYRLRDYTERGPLEKLCLPDAKGKRAPLVDSLHRLLWLKENEPRSCPHFWTRRIPTADACGSWLKHLREQDCPAVAKIKPAS